MNYATPNHIINIINSMTNGGGRINLHAINFLEIFPLNNYGCIFHNNTLDYIIHYIDESPNVPLNIIEDNCLIPIVQYLMDTGQFNVFNNITLHDLGINDTDRPDRVIRGHYQTFGSLLPTRYFNTILTIIRHRNFRISGINMPIYWPIQLLYFIMVERNPLCVEIISNPFVINNENRDIILILNTVYQSLLQGNDRNIWLFTRHPQWNQNMEDLLRSIGITTFYLIYPTYDSPLEFRLRLTNEQIRYICRILDNVLNYRNN